MNTPTLKTILADAKKYGFTVKLASRKVNGKSAFNVQGKPGLFTKQGLMDLIGIYN